MPIGRCWGRGVGIRNCEAVALTLTLIFLCGSWDVELGVLWLFCLAVGLDVVRESGFVVFLVFFIKTFHLGGLNVWGFGW